MTSNLYKVGDWVYCEASPHQPYVIRKIEELTKTPCGNVEAKVICAFRRQDIPAPILASIEKYQSKNAEKGNNSSDSNSNDSTTTSSSTGALPLTAATTTSTTATTTNNTVPTACGFDESEVNDLTELQRYNLKHRELYFSKYTDTIAATTIRAKCSVLLFNEEVERYADYINRDDGFFYHLTYDPYQKSIVADKGEIRVGSRYQAEVPLLKQAVNGSNGTAEDGSDNSSTPNSHTPVQNDRVLRSQLQRMASQKDGGKEAMQPLIEIPILAQDEQIVWCPMGGTYGGIYSNQLTDQEIEKFLLLAKSVGTYARALDCTNAFKQPSLSLSAATASRDITLFNAMNALHEANYDIGKAALSLITTAGPIICKDEMEDWSASEANLFEDALDKYGKDFIEIRKDYLPWKSLKSIIEYYYIWKTTDRYVQPKRIKQSEQESKLKQVYIPNHSKQNQSALIKSSHVQLFNQYDIHLKASCDSCGAPSASTNQWYVYNPSNLTQLIMSGNTNPTVLANAAATQSASTTSSSTNGIAHAHYQARVCSDCWLYWKRFAAFKYPSNARQERINQLKNQVHKCSVNGCGREFKVKTLLVKHCGIAHGYFAKTATPPGQTAGGNPRPAAMRNRTSFYLYTTPMTQAARLVCTNSVKLKRLARKPFKLVELPELTKEWNKEVRNITQLLDDFKKRTFVKRKLSKQLISVIYKNYMKILKKKKRQAEHKSAKSAKLVNGTNDHPSADEIHHNENNSNDAANYDDDDEENDDELVIDNDTNSAEDKPEFLKYFEQKCTTPCYTPESLAFAKPNSEQMNKFYLNLMSQNRKRPHEASGNSLSNGEMSAGKNGTAQTESSCDSSPLSKRSLLNNQQPAKLSNQAAGSITGANPASASSSAKSIAQHLKQPVRTPQKSLKPPQAGNSLNAPEEIYYVANRHLKSLRREIQNVALRRLARKPYKPLAKQYHNLYDTFSDLRTESLLKITTALAAVETAAAVATKPSTDVTETDTGDAKTEEESKLADGLEKKQSESKTNGTTDDDIIENGSKEESIDDKKETGEIEKTEKCSDESNKKEKKETGTELDENLPSQNDVNMAEEAEKVDAKLDVENNADKSMENAPDSPKLSESVVVLD